MVSVPMIMLLEFSPTTLIAADCFISPVNTTYCVMTFGFPKFLKQQAMEESFTLKLNIYYSRLLIFKVQQLSSGTHKRMQLPQNYSFVINMEMNVVIIHFPSSYLTGKNIIGSFTSSITKRKPGRYSISQILSWYHQMHIQQFV